MALKPDRSAPNAEVTDIRQYWTTTQTTKDKGGVASLVTQGSGVAMDDVANIVSYLVDPSGAIPIGVLLQDVRPPLSETRDFKNFSNLEIRPGDKCALLKKGEVVTDLVVGAPTAGSVAYLAPSGYLTSVETSGVPIVGRFETVKDSDGFIRVTIDLP